MSLDIKIMSRADLDVALGWARDEGWNPGLGDADPFYAQDPTGYLMGWLDGEPIGCVSVVKYDHAFAFLGLYIVRPAWRAQGYGKAIWDAGVASAGDRTIGLDGVVAQQDNYRKSGFVLAHRTVRWGGVGSPPGYANSQVRPVTPADFPAIATVDRGAFPAARPAFLSRWLTATPTRHSLCFEERGRILGFGTIRRSVEGRKVGPLFAERRDVGEALLHALVAGAGGEPVFIDIPAPNDDASQLAIELGFTPGFETARMYRGEPPLLPLTSVIGITSLELG